jgi:hypothetical protein
LPRHRDHNDVVGNLEPGQTLCGEPIVETIPEGGYSWDARLAEHARDNFFPRSTPTRAPRPAFKTRSLRR